ncbi:PAS domain-containing sensor histidine kinase [Flavitalea sp.]|nr:PAS domain S-box protein [Flavitalea sp.]
MIDRDYLLEVFKASRNPCFIVLPDSPVFTIVAASKIFLSAIAANENEIINKSTAEIFPGSPAATNSVTESILIQSFNKVIVTAKSQPVANWCPDPSHLNANQELMYWEGESIPLFDEMGALKYILHSAIDITDRERVAEKIRDSEEKSRLIMNAALDAIICMDIRGDITFWNPKAKALFGWDTNEVMGKKLSTFIIPERFRHRHDAGLDHYLRTGEKRALNRILELDGLRRGGDEFPVELTVIPISQPNESFFCAFIRDISARKKAEENIKQQAIQLEISNKELEQFAYVASHDLQEPLRMVTSFLKQLESRYSDIIDDRGKQYIHFAVDGAKRMRQIILDLLEFSKVGRWEKRMEPVDIKKLVQESLQLLANQIEEAGAMVTIRPLPVISTYKTPLTQVFQNLLSNALKYRQDARAPLIEISAQENESDWEFCVKDNGIGISKEYYERVFVIFQRLHNRGEYSGTGIGLAIVKKIITHLGGKIWINSQEGKGTAFHFTIPKSDSSGD